MTRPTPAAGGSRDRELLARVAEGDEAAFGELYDRHVTALHALAWRITGRRAESEEVVLETFAQAWREASRFEPANGSVAAWLVSIARRRALEAARGVARRAKAPTGNGAGPDDEDAHHATGRLVRRVREAVAQLTVGQREAIELAFYEGRSPEGIAAGLDEAPGTIKARLRLGMQKLREGLAPVIEERQS